MQESLLSGLRQEFGEVLSDDERRFDDNSLEPFNCSRCDSWASPLWSYCKSCDTELDEELRLHNQADQEEIQEAHAMKNTMLDLANKRMEEMKNNT